MGAPGRRFRYVRPRRAGVIDDGSTAEVVKDPNCELCVADRFTHWYSADEVCWVADCEACSVPMVVWNGHGDTPPPEVIEHCLAALAAAATTRFGADGWEIDRQMRQVPGHFHAHARDPQWWSLRMQRPLSRFTGIGAVRQTH